MFRGKKPQGARLTLVKGNPGKRPINEAEPEPKGEVRKPAFVKGKAAQLWKQYAPDLTANGVLTPWDVDMFGAWCCLMAEFQVDPNRFITAKLTQMRALGEAFGLIPPGRARLKTTRPDGKTEDTTAEFFG